MLSLTKRFCEVIREKEKEYPQIPWKDEGEDIYYIVCRIQEILEEKKSALIAIDGMCGGGKTVLSEILQEIFSARVFHVDDFYLPLEKRKEGWEKEGGSNIDFTRMFKEVVLPAKEGRTVYYQPYSCREQKKMQMTAIEGKAVSIVEGSYSEHPKLADAYDLKVFIACSKKEQKRRLLEREGERYHNFEERWIPMEMQYFQKYSIEKKSDVIFQTSL